MEQQGDDMIVCPYNKYHVIRAQRFVRHIMKCRKNNSLIETVTCPYNARHIVGGPELQYHLDQCPDHKLWQYKQVKEQSLLIENKTGDLTDPPYSQMDHNMMEESWEDESAINPDGRKCIVEMDNKLLGNLSEEQARRKVFKKRKERDALSNHSSRRPNKISSCASSVMSLNIKKMYD